MFNINFFDRFEISPTWRAIRFKVATSLFNFSHFYFRKSKWKCKKIRKCLNVWSKFHLYVKFWDDWNKYFGIFSKWNIRYANARWGTTVPAEYQTKNLLSCGITSNFFQKPIISRTHGKIHVQKPPLSKYSKGSCPFESFYWSFREYVLSNCECTRVQRGKFLLSDIYTQVSREIENLRSDEIYWKLVSANILRFVSISLNF